MKDFADFTSLMEGVCANESGSFDELMDAHGEEMVNYFHKHCWSRELAEDLAQELFVKLYMKRDQFSTAQSKGKGYMYSIAHNLWVDHCRRKAVRREITIEEYEVGCYEDDPAEGLHFAQVQHDVRSALQEISAKHREIVLLVVFQKLSYKEVSDTLDIAVGTVKSRVHNGLKKMQEILREKHDYEQL